MGLRAVGVAQLRANLSKYLGTVATGDELVVMDRGRPVARIIPFEDRTPGDAHTDHLIRAGALRRGTGRIPKDFWTARRPADRRGAVLRALLEERAQGR